MPLNQMPSKHNDSITKYIFCQYSLIKRPSVSDIRTDCVGDWLAAKMPLMLHWLFLPSALNVKSEEFQISAGKRYASLFILILDIYLLTLSQAGVTMTRNSEGYDQYLHRLLVHFCETWAMEVLVGIVKTALFSLIRDGNEQSGAIFMI